MDNFHSYLDNLSARYGRNKVFPDFLDIVVCCLSMKQQEDLYFKTIKGYNKDDLDVFVSAFAALVVEMDNNGEGLKDVLGCYFEEYFHNEKLGQFFTPPSVCRIMNSLVSPDGTTYDPCCGSGRLFLEAAKENRNIMFYGADISDICCKMTLINMCLNGLKCRISWMDSLSLEVFGEWAVLIHPIYKNPYIVKLEIQEKEIQKAPQIEQKEFAFEDFSSEEQTLIKKTKYKKFIA